MSLPPVEIPLGAIRFNSDSQKLEYWNGDIWMQIHTFSPNVGGNGGPSGNPSGNSADLASGVRGIISGGTSPGASPYAKTDKIQYITISTAGNAIDFGDLLAAKGTTASCASNTRGLNSGGTPSAVNQFNMLPLQQLETHKILVI